MTPAGLPPVALKCAHLGNPLAVATDRIRFSWLLTGRSLQHAYQVQVIIQNARVDKHSGCLPAPAPFWDSGQTTSGSAAVAGGV